MSDRISALCAAIECIYERITGDALTIQINESGNANLTIKPGCSDLPEYPSRQHGAQSPLQRVAELEQYVAQLRSQFLHTMHHQSCP